MNSQGVRTGVWGWAGALLTVVGLGLGTPVPASTQTADSAFEGMNARVVGPSGTSGRIAAVDAWGHPVSLIYAGAATGGVWKSTDGGATWHPIFDDQPVSSIGAVKINPNNPDVVWVGTGEANPRNSMGSGRGVYRTLDGGDSWSFLGLENTERISRIYLHPTDEDIAWVAALGPAWHDSEARGVYKTTDGGENWEKVLYIDERTGIADMVQDPSNPNHLIAATWSFRRQPWFFESGGEGTGVHVTYDGGESWKKLGLDEGLPGGELGRIGLGFATNEPDVVYMMVEVGNGQLLRSEDGGDSWRTVNSQPGINPRPFYFTDIRIDPTNENRIYRLQVTLDVSHDGGQNWEQSGDGAHVHLDHHALWIDPVDGETLINGNDGGIYISRDRGESWRFVQNLPLAQFYHLSVDDAVPFNIYGGLQDNGSWRGPSQVWEVQGFTGSNIQAWHWKAIGFGDGFAAYPDPLDDDLAYSSWQGGNLQRVDLRTGEWKDIQPLGPDSVALRFNWNAGMALDPLRPGTIYYGSQFLHRTTDRGHSWETISPDLTSNDPEKQLQDESGGVTRDDTGAENHTTILTIAPSPSEAGIIWTGSDDGKVYLTRDDGQSWTDVTPDDDQVPEGSWVAHVEASHHSAGTAYAAINNYRRGDWTTYLMRTTDFGENWTNLDSGDADRDERPLGAAGVDDSQIDGWVHAIEEDPVTPRLLWAGSEFGLFVSTDAGESWAKWTHGVPTVPVRSLVTHPRDHDLVVGTHGRAAMVLDDIRPVREMAAEPQVESTALHAFTAPDAWQHNRGLTGPFIFPGYTTFEGANRPGAAILRFWMAEPVAEDEDDASEAGSAATEVWVEVTDGEGDLVRRFRTQGSPGVNTVLWPMNRDGYWGWFQTPDEDGPRPGGVAVLPGEYTVTFMTDSDTASTPIVVRDDPRRTVPLAERRAKAEAIEELARAGEEVGEWMRRLAATAESIDEVMDRLPEEEAAEEEMNEGAMDEEGMEGDETSEDEGDPTLRERARSVRQEIDSIRNELRPAPGGSPYIQNTTVTGDLQGAMGSLGSSNDRPTEAQLEMNRRVLDRLAEVRERIETFYADDVAELIRAVDEAGIGIIATEAES